MSNRFNGWLCLQIFALSLIGNAAALAEDVKNDTLANPPAVQSETQSNTKSSSASETGATSPAQATPPNSAQPVPQGEGVPTTSSGDTTVKESSPQVTPADQGGVKTEQKPSAQPAKPARSIEAHTTTPATKASPVASSKRLVLYGRIEQIAAGTGAQFRIVLKSEKARMDTSHPQLKASVSESALRGSVVRSFPTDFDGVWGGSLTVWTMQQSPLCWEIDPDEAKYTQLAMKSGLVGQTNFNFSRDRANQIELEPAKILFAVPMKDTNEQEQLNRMLASSGLNSQVSSPGMGDFMRQFVGSMANSMTVPMILSLGNVHTSGMEHGLSGNEFEEQVVRNVIRELAPGVLEQLYAQVATVSYTQNRQFRRKIILYGTLRRGVVVNTTPDPTGGFGNMFNLPQGGSGQMPRMPQLPPGQNPFENLFPH